MSGWVRLLRAGAGTFASAVADRRHDGGGVRTRQSIVRSSLALAFAPPLGAAVDVATLGDIAAALALPSEAVNATNDGSPFSKLKGAANARGSVSEGREARAGARRLTGRETEWFAHLSRDAGRTQASARFATQATRDSVSRVSAPKP